MEMLIGAIFDTLLIVVGFCLLLAPLAWLADHGKRNRWWG